jgi:hypothetical protein
VQEMMLAAFQVGTATLPLVVSRQSISIRLVAQPKYWIMSNDLHNNVGKRAGSRSLPTRAPQWFAKS